MSRRADWLAIAEALKRAHDRVSGDTRYGVTLAAHELAGLFEGQAAGFDAALFLRNCGVTEDNRCG
jgi:hypothetical protein